MRRQNEALEAADRVKSEFIANISYELRAPLNTIIGFSEILQQRYFGELNVRQEDYVKGVLESSMSLLKLINDILDLSSIEAGYMSITPSEFNIQNLIEEVIQLLTHRSEAKKQSLKVKCDLNCTTWISDEKRLKQAIFNLISNAINYTHDGGKITIQTEVKNNELVIAVSDSGIGIAKEDQERVFRKFERGNKRASGVGLGLSLVKSLIELHGGRIELESQVKKGTTVTCYLPQSCAMPQAIPRTPEVVEYSK
ncbi:PAS domain-containing sensor histidine kinase [Candidatus Bealeia paramacronuclearis]|uniref:histidine kinase n=1 Tax=Candidatus Bealeia paramacronuclearis TaxID=1921001 RepID=A0ABZ2C205_9PROT|nr:PAS domain-containing sensor histidine kinase [Candidatus Bealeia paramacronuclearis]